MNIVWPVTRRTALLLAPPMTLYAANAPAGKSNILLILADDLGWSDLGEKTDIASQMPDKAASLLKQLHHWRTQVGDPLGALPRGRREGRQAHLPGCIAKEPYKKQVRHES